ncbi:MAG: glycosyltransferase family 2 protein [Bacteroidales bacterium]|nr:glycosyltransferase family 2 protein [Bacteroidales bacterium]
MNIKKIKTTAVIPAFNEASRIKDVINKTKKFVDEIIVVNDCSTDKTSEVAKSTGVTVIDLPYNRGAGFATRTGCDKAIENNTDLIVTLDADGQHCAEDIPNLVNKIIVGKHDIIFGYRIRTKSMPFIKKVGNRLLIFISYILFGIKLKDALTGFHLFTSEAYPKIRWKSEKYEFILEYVYNVYKNKLNYTEVKIKTIYVNKTHGMEIKDGLKAIRLLFQWRFNIEKKH